MDNVDIKDIEIHDAQWQKNKLNRRKIAIPVYGSISCGMLKFINNNIEGYVEIPKHMVGEGDYCKRYNKVYRISPIKYTGFRQKVYKFLP